MTLAILAVPVGLLLLLGAEIVVAIVKPHLPPSDPFELSGLVGADAGAAPLDMVWIGDSVTAGVGASDIDETLPRRVARALHRPVRLRVFAVSGERVEDALDEQVRMLEVLEEPPDVVILEIGANDVVHLTGRSDFRAAYQELLDRATAIGAEHVLSLGIPAFGTAPRFLQPLRGIVGWSGRRLDEVIREVVAGTEVTYVDIAGSTARPFDENPGRYYAADEFHPSDEGYALWADAVLDALERVGIEAGG